MNDTAKTLLAFVGGAAVGAAIGILLAPEAGADTRKRIANRVKDIGDTADEKYQEFLAWKDKMVNKAQDVKENLKNKAEDEVERFRSTVNQGADKAESKIKNA